MTRRRAQDAGLIFALQPIKSSGQPFKERLRLNRARRLILSAHKAFYAQKCGGGRRPPAFLPAPSTAYDAKRFIQIGQSVLRFGLAGKHAVHGGEKLT
jgi:hypothetical protein